MPGRNRVERVYHTGRRFYIPTNSTVYHTAHVITKQCDDVVEPGDNGPVSMEIYDKVGGMLNGENGPGNPHRWYDYPTAFPFENPWANEHVPIPAGPTDGELATQLLARTNPSRSSTDGLVALAELREIPGLIRESYGLAMNKLFKFIPERAFRTLSKAAKLNLMIQFGILPLVGDLRTCYQFQKLVDSRAKELDKLNTKGLRRTVTLRTDTSSLVQPVVFQSNIIWVEALLTKRTSYKWKGHIRYYPKPHAIPLSESEQRDQIVKLIYGLHFDVKNLYEALPWSWLVDYFFNLGTYLSATRNQLDVTHDSPRIIHDITTDMASHSHSCPPGVTMTPYKHRRRTYQRRIVPATITARTEALTAQQWSILGSLSVLKLI
jgi:hypothetical protein